VELMVEKYLFRRISNTVLYYIVELILLWIGNI